MIYASSGAGISGYANQFPYREIAQGEYEKVPQRWSNLTHETQVWPQGIYGCTKVWGEALARHFSDSSDMSFICLRIGAVKFWTVRLVQNPGLRGSVNMILTLIPLLIFHEQVSHWNFDVVLSLVFQCIFVFHFP